MPPRLPDRYRLEVRLGRDGDVEEWLATDETLDRPVLIEVLGPETTDDRRHRFVEAVRAIAGVAHTHVATVYAASELPDGAFAVLEWTGGITLADRIEAGEPIQPHEFLPNAAGVAEGLAALHDAGIVHGAIDTRAISFSAAHPAKLRRAGRPYEHGSAITDVHDLSVVLETGLTGRTPGLVPPSQVVDGVPQQIDAVLDAARKGALDAHRLADQLRAIPTVDRRPASMAWSRRWLIGSMVLVLGAVGLIAAASAMNRSQPGASPIPEGSTVTTMEAGTTSTTTSGIGPPTSSTIPTTPIVIDSIRSFDPLADGAENDARLPNLTDGDSSTEWRTETYFDPLGLIKAGVGITMSVSGTPTDLELTALSEGTSFSLRWSPTLGEDLADWEVIASGRSLGEPIDLPLPPRAGGHWLLWLTELTPTPEGDFRSTLGEVRFLP